MVVVTGTDEVDEALHEFQLLLLASTVLETATIVAATGRKRMLRG